MPIANRAATDDPALLTPGQLLRSAGASARQASASARRQESGLLGTVCTHGGPCRSGCRTMASVLGAPLAMARSRLPLLAAALMVMQPFAVLADQKAIIEEILDGPELYIDTTQARVKQKAKPPQTISTGLSRGQIRFSTGATGRLNHHSLMRLGQSCFLLNQGQVLISGPQNACTRSTRLSVRGTNFLLDVNDREETQLSVLEGSVELELLRDGQPIESAISRVKAGQKLQFSSVSGALSLIPLNREDYVAILQGPLFRDFRSPLAERKRLKRYLNQTYPELIWTTPASEPDSQIQEGPVAIPPAEIRPIRPWPVPLLPPQGHSLGDDPRLVTWKREHDQAPSASSCWSQVQSYYQSIARVYGDWRAPKPSRKGRYITRIDFDLSSSGTDGLVKASNFVINRSSGEDSQDRSALAEARRKSHELPPPPACVGGRLRVYHQFIVEYF